MVVHHLFELFRVESGKGTDDTVIEELLRENKQLKLKNLDLDQHCRNVEVCSLESRNENLSLRKELAAARRQYAEVKNLHATSERNREARGDELQMALEACEQLEKRYETSQKNLERERRIVAQLKTDLRESGRKVSRLETDANTVRKKSQQLEQLVDEQRKESAKSQQRIRLAQHEAEKHLASSSQFQRERNELQSQLVHLAAQVRELEAKLASTRSNNDALRVQNADLVVAYKDLETAYAILEKDAVDAVEESEQTIAALKAKATS